MNLELFASLDNLIKTATNSPSQLRQDAVALFFNDFRQNGFFVEFGACDGFSFSNTYVLEKGFGWAGILSEPNPEWHPALSKGRQCYIDHRAVASKTGEHVEFSIINDITPISKELCGITDYLAQSIAELSQAYKINQKEVVNKTISVETVSLLDLLKTFHAPRTIDYLSIDTEGSELSILSAFDFSEYKFTFLSVEHNYRPERGQIQRVMNDNGYIRLDCDALSNFDDWYIHQSHTLSKLVNG